jgi:hypothetical protein
MAIHVTIIFICVSLISLLIFKSKEIRVRSVFVICFLLFIIAILGPETFFVYICCTSIIEKLVIGILFFVELTFYIFVLLILRLKRNE